MDSGKVYKNFLTGFIKSTIAVILLPVLVGLVKSFSSLLVSLIPLTSPEIWFVAGFVVFFLMFLFKSLPGVLYVFGHELTHAVWAVLFRGKIRKFNVSSISGSVITNRANFLILLAPYFFPIYTFLIIFIFYILAFTFDVAKWIEWLFFLVGISYSFHIFLTFESLSVSQSDIKKTGRIFSYTVIVILNLIITVVILKFISPDKISITKYFSDGMTSAAEIYKYLWEYLTELYFLV